MTVTDNQTPNFGIPLPHRTNAFSDDVDRLVAAFMLVDTRLQEIVNQTQDPDAATLGGATLAQVRSLALMAGILPMSKGGTGASDPAGARAAIEFDAAWDAKFAAQLATLPELLNTLAEITAAIQNNESVGDGLLSQIATINAQITDITNQLGTIDGQIVAILAAQALRAAVTGANGALETPAGTTAQRPAGNPAAGVVWKRRNTETGENEANYGAGWEDEGGGGAWIDHGLSGVTSGATREWTGLPPGILKLDIVTESYAQIPNQRLLLTLGDSGGYETSGYGSTASRLSDGLILENFAAGFLLNGSQQVQNYFGRWRIERQSPENNSWFMGMAVFRHSQAPIGLYGRKILSGELDRLRMSCPTSFQNEFRVRYQLA
ncbi:MAG: hypothetical protein AAGH43_06175 [Pseudomonadota bacterium]